MNRITRRTLAVIAGLVIGWYAAGMVGPHLPLVGVSVAETTHEADVQGHGAGHDDHADNEATALVPHEAMPWLQPVIVVAIGLFIAAIVLGPAAMSIRGPELPDPADDHEDH